MVRQTVERIFPLLDPRLADEIARRWASLTKPPGSLGRLEDLVLHYALIRGTALPVIQRKAIFIFCADHGVVAEKVSAFPQQVTRQMVRNFLRGGAAINVLCRAAAIEPVVVDVGVCGPPETGVLNYKVREGTANFAYRQAMTTDEANAALEIGIRLASDAAARYDVTGIGEMGIGNTTSASALLSAFTGRDPFETAGRGAGVDAEGLQRKVAAIRQGLGVNRDLLVSPFGILQAVGGLEIAAMAGFILGAAARRLPVVIDGFIATAAAMVARAMAPDSLDAAIFSHRSGEQAHEMMLRFLNVQPQIDLAMRLGEGTGAALAIQLLENALRLYREMATFEEAQVSAR